MTWKSAVFPLAVLLAGAGLAGQDSHVDPTFLHRFVPGLKEQASDVTTPTCHYKPIFGEGDPDARIVRSIARFGEMTIAPGGMSAMVQYASEEQVYMVVEGNGSLHYGDERVALRKNDYVYLPPGKPHGMANPSGQGCRVLVMGFRIPQGVTVSAPTRIMSANVEDVKKEVVGNHPPTTLYQLLMGDTQSKRDKLAAARILTSLFTMEFAADGTNMPHHHEREEEIYLVLNGHGEMVAGSGLNGVEGRYHAQAGDAYFFRLNCTVGFYSGNKPGEEKARILAARSLFPSPCR